MKVKEKGGRVFPPPPPSPSSSSSVNGKRGGEENVLSVLNLLPAAILALISILCFEDREVIAYMITRSINAANPSPSIVLTKKPTKKSNRKNNPTSTVAASSGGLQGHKRRPVFYCDCFDCYIKYWYRWNSSPNRELIHEVIDAFDEHLSSDEKSRKSPKSGKRRHRGKLRNGENSKPLISPVNKTDHKPPSTSPMENVLYPITSSKTPANGSAMSVRSLWSTYKGFARKMLLLPVLLGLLNSRLWSLWNPNA